MVIRVRLVGSGKPADPFTVPLPTFAMVDCDYNAMTALVDVPDDVLPAKLAQQFAVPHAPTLADKTPLPDLTAFHVKWLAHLDQVYAEHAGKFKPQVI